MRNTPVHPKTSTAAPRLPGRRWARAGSPGATHKPMPAGEDILTQRACAGGTPSVGSPVPGQHPLLPRTPGTAGEPQPWPSRAVLADIGWRSPSASVPGGPGRGDRRVTGHRVTQQQEQRSAPPGPAPPGPQPDADAERCQGSPRAAAARRRLGLGHCDILDCPQLCEALLPAPCQPPATRQAGKGQGPVAMQVGKGLMPCIQAALPKPPIPGAPPGRPVPA